MLAYMTNHLTSNVPFQPTRPTTTNAQVDWFASSRSGVPIPLAPSLSSTDMIAGHRLRSTGDQVRVKIPVKTWRRTRCGRNCGQQVWATQSSVVRGRRVHHILGQRPVCHSCGSPVDDSDAHAEQVTVLFADVVHSMDIASDWCGAVARDHGRAGRPRGGGGAVL